MARAARRRRPGHRAAVASGTWAGARWELADDGCVLVTGAFTVADPGGLPLVVLLSARRVVIEADTSAVESVDGLVRDIGLPVTLRGAGRDDIR